MYWGGCLGVHAFRFITPIGVSRHSQVVKDGAQKILCA